MLSDEPGHIRNIAPAAGPRMLRTREIGIVSPPGDLTLPGTEPEGTEPLARPSIRYAGWPPWSAASMTPSTPASTFVSSAGIR